MRRLAGVIAVLGVGLAGLAAGVRAQDPLTDSSHARGLVFEDGNGNGKWDPGEAGLRGVRVSNGRQVVATDRDGRWRLPVTDDTPLFVIKPRGWMTPLDEQNLPRFYYLHKPAGSPPLRFGGVPPTGPLPASIDFPLHRQREPDRFRAIFWADPQPRDQKEIDYISHDVVEELVGTDASFGVTLGDIMFDDLSLFDSLNGAVALIGIPWYNVLGNHDINYDATHDRYSDDTFERHYGPSYYSFDHGPVHFIVLDDVNWSGRTETDRGRYTAGLGPDQLEFVKNDLALVPKEQLVVLMMHIPLTGVTDRQELYRLIEERPYTMSISGHTHYQEHRLITKEDGWRGPQPHHHVINVTVSGSWWSGPPDERGIPHTLMRDGAPNGYSIATFDGRKFSFEFKAASRAKEYQIAIHAPEAVEARAAGMCEVFANVFNGGVQSMVEMRLGAGDVWVPMQKITAPDPGFLALKKLEEATPPPPGRKLPAVMMSPHLWRGVLPRGAQPGVREIQVRATDAFGRTHTASRVLRVK